MATSKYNRRVLEKLHNIDELLKVAQELGMTSIKDIRDKDLGTPEDLIEKIKTKDGRFIVDQTLDQTQLIRVICEHIDYN